MLRGHVVPGPQSLSSSVPGLPAVTINDIGHDTSAPVLTLVVRSPQGAYRYAYVALYKRNEIRVIAQGFTNQEGKLQVFGAEPGDILRAISIDGGLAGSLVVTAAAQLDLIMAPVYARSAQVGPLPHVRMLALPSRKDGETELLLQLIDFSAGAQPKLTLVDANGSAAMLAVGYSPETGIYTSSITASGAAIRSGSVVVEANETDRYRSSQLSYEIQKVDGADYREVFAADGNLGLRIMPRSKGVPSEATELLVLTSSFLPGALPAGTELVGAVYDITAGAMGALDQAALLSLYYHFSDLVLVPGGSVPIIYRWDPNLAQWEPLPTQVEAERQVATTSITRLGAYALLLTAPPASETDLYLPLIIDAH